MKNMIKREIKNVYTITEMTTALSMSPALSSACIARMTMYDLKIQCKKRNLMITGNKQDLIDRLLDKKNETCDVLKSELEIVGLDDDQLDNRTSLTTIDLLLAAKHGFIYAANHFGDRGATNFKDAIKLAARYGNKLIVEFCKHRGKVTEFDEAMALAARHGHKDIVTMCKMSGAKDFNTDGYGVCS